MVEDDRRAVWELLFGDTPMPTIEENAVERFCGILDREIICKPTEAELRQIFREVRDKYSKRNLV